MKTKNLILPVVALLFSLAACEVEEPFSKRTEVVEGLPVTVTIPFATKAKAVVTRAAQDEDLENRVNNAYLLIFDEAGNKIGGRYCTQGDGMNQVSDSTGTLETNAISQNRARIVGIANLNDGSTSTAYDLTPAMLDAITTYDQLCSLQMKLSERSVQRGSTFIMTGVAIDKTDENNSEWVQIPGSESGKVQLNCRLRFERTDAKVKFVVTTNKKESFWEYFSFQPKEWRVCKVPAQALVIRDAKGGDADGEGTEYFSSRAVNFEEITRDPLTASYQGGSFVFYMPENKKSPKMNISEQGTEAEQYALRDKQDKNEPAEGDELVLGQEVVNGEFTYANENSTYVEMTGTLSYEYTRPNDRQRYYVEADVRYVIHLGYASGDPNDYDTDRNCNYTYTVTVRGINDIEVEVTADPQGPGEVRPGAEGDVIYSRAGVYEFDAHYDRRLITINLSDIPDGQTDPDAANGVTWGVRTPFSNGIYDLNAPDNFSGIEDYKWVKFAINSDYGVANDKFVKYPGDQNYNDLRPEAVNDNQRPGTNEHGLYGEGWENARLLDVQQFVKRINEMKKDPNKPATVAVTVFIDEYVYYRNPVTYDNELSLWKYSVDQPDRMMYIFIVPGDSKYSPDGESLVINSVLTFRQKSLRTIYDVNNPDLTNGNTIDDRQGLWGLESIMETGRLETGGSAIANGDSRSNGRRNTLRCMLGKDYNNNESLHWSDVLNTSDHYAMNSGYKNALYACLMRNRDLNGDNVVQANEIRWYLASVNQLVDIYIGEYALDREAWLYPENPADRDNKTYWHYTTSTYNNGNPEVLWSEEGASLGSYGASQSSNGSLYAYRCVRNLGITLDNPDTEPLPLYTCTETTNGEYLIDVTRLTPNSRRENFEPGYLPEHTDIQISNLPYARFQVQGADSDFPTPEYEIEYYGPLDYGLEFTNEQTWEECLQYEDRGSLTAGYRLPNQRELLIMLNILPEDKAWRSYQESHWTGTKSKKAMYMCKTRFSRAGKDHFGANRRSFRMNANDKSIGLLNDATSDRGYIRAVKDVR